MRLLATKSTKKNDPHDALSIAVAALRAPSPKEVGVEDHVAVMKLWARRHRNLSSTRTQVACRLHAVLCDLIAGGVRDEIYAEKAASLLANIEPDTAVAAARVELAEELLDDLLRVDHQLAESKKRLEQVVAASGTCALFGTGVGVWLFRGRACLPSRPRSLALPAGVGTSWRSSAPQARAVRCAGGRTSMHSTRPLQPMLLERRPESPVQ